MFFLLISLIGAFGISLVALMLIARADPERGTVMGDMGLSGRGAKLELVLPSQDRLTLAQSQRNDGKASGERWATVKNFRWYRLSGEVEERSLKDLRNIVVYNTDKMPRYGDSFLALDFGDIIWMLACGHHSYESLFEALSRELDLDVQLHSKAAGSTCNSSFRIWPRIQAQETEVRASFAGGALAEHASNHI